MRWLWKQKLSTIMRSRYERDWIILKLSHKLINHSRLNITSQTVWNGCGSKPVSGNNNSYSRKKSKFMAAREFWKKGYNYHGRSFFPIIFGGPQKLWYGWKHEERIRPVFMNVKRSWEADETSVEIEWRSSHQFCLVIKAHFVCHENFHLFNFKNFMFYFSISNPTILIDFLYDKVTHIRFQLTEFQTIVTFHRTLLNCSNQFFLLFPFPRN